MQLSGSRLASDCLLAITRALLVIIIVNSRLFIIDHDGDFSCETPARSTSLHGPDSAVLLPIIDSPLVQLAEDLCSVCMCRSVQFVNLH